MEYLIGVICGVVCGLLLVAVILKLTKNDGSIKCKYDERQQILRGKGFKYGFFSLIIYNMIYALADSVLEKVYAESSVIIFIGICFGVIVYAGYCIWHEAYFSLNENPKKVIVAFLLIAVINFIVTAFDIKESKLVKNGVLQFEAINFLCGIFMLIIVFEILIKKVFAKREAE